jgi:hypothetical protein
MMEGKFMIKYISLAISIIALIIAIKAYIESRRD